MGNTVQSDKKTLLDKIRTIPDFPKKGISFKDFTPLLADKDTLKLTSKLLKEPFNSSNVDFVVGLESRGFIFGPIMARDLNSGFIPVRKPNKLPAKTISHSYDLEYGSDSFEIHRDAISGGANVVIHDDLVATGGSAMACAQLIEKLGGNIIGFSFIMQIKSLSGFRTLKKTYKCHTLLEV